MLDVTRLLHPSQSTYAVVDVVHAKSVLVGPSCQVALRNIVEVHAARSSSVIGVNGSVGVGAIGSTVADGVVVNTTVVTKVAHPTLHVEHGPCAVTVGVKPQHESAGGT